MLWLLNLEPLLGEELSAGVPLLGTLGELWGGKTRIWGDHSPFCPVPSKSRSAPSAWHEVYSP